MNSLAPYLDELKKMKELGSDAELARFLGVSRTHISQIRSGIHMGELLCFELALMLKRKPIELLALNRAIRSKDSRLKRYWLDIHSQCMAK
ncbi:hypothetical protein [Pseudohongiella sp.]|uniref:HTH cro/C1-type domain-containing protein n=1 Tax=marine sediment metagenome TaxID=412755 RepID=A0A0F9Z4K5_9ZZZZ|nr:hypothetical protein [Pseudohongiella sp.]HDZ07744.1 hypothetical protein [Pseudohongiella sp.]HEA62939.1 hypothetical protein [Pseudohongiella sp.]